MRFRFGVVFAAAAVVALFQSACSSPPAAAGKAAMTTQVYDVRDLLFAAPTRTPSRSSAEDLAAALRAGTDASYWRTGHGSICAEDSGYLAVTADGAMQENVRSALDQMRRLAAPPAGR